MWVTLYISKCLISIYFDACLNVLKVVFLGIKVFMITFIRGLPLKTVVLYSFLFFKTKGSLQHSSSPNNPRFLKNTKFTLNNFSVGQINQYIWSKTGCTFVQQIDISLNCKYKLLVYKLSKRSFFF